MEQPEPERDDPTLVQGARICVWRVFGINNDYLTSKASAPDWTTEIKDWLASGDSTTVTVGGPPTLVADAMNAATATMLTSFGGGEWRKAEDPLRARDEAIDESLRNHGRPEFLDGQGLWVTLQISRPIEVPDTGTRYAWVTSREALRFSEEFELEAERHLDAVAAYVSHALGDMRFDRTLVGNNLAYFMAPGKMPFSFGRSQVFPVTVSLSRDWKSLPVADITNTLEAAKSVPPRTLKGISSAARLLWLAKAEEDALRRFLFAFVGLELLVNAFVTSSVRDEVVSLLKIETSGLPVEGLFWPTTHSDKDYPWRNLAFKFSLMTIALSRTTAADDVELFKMLNKARNSIAHGSASESDTYPSRECIELFDRYLTLAYARTLSGKKA